MTYYCRNDMWSCVLGSCKFMKHRRIGICPKRGFKWGETAENNFDLEFGEVGVGV